jgi:hypothetical protein
MKMLFLATVAGLVFSLSSNAQAQKAKFNDKFCVPYCTNYCAEFVAGRKPRFRRLPDGTWQALPPPAQIEDTPERRQRCMATCMPMCREQGH